MIASDDGGETWALRGSTTVPHAERTFDEHMLVQLASGELWMLVRTLRGLAESFSTDGGRTWAGIDGTGTTGIPDLPVHVVIVDPTNTARLYAGTDAGVFTSIDGGANWYKEVTGYANVVTESLSLSTIDDIQLYAFTHGRSAWRVSLNR